MDKPQADQGYMNALYAVPSIILVNAFSAGSRVPMRSFPSPQLGLWADWESSSRLKKLRLLVHLVATQSGTSEAAGDVDQEDRRK